jgi:hypothetical protein
MGAIHRLLERLGLVKLDRYGLLLTPDGRIMASRPAILDDGLGGRIVGWLDEDLAAMELEKWERAQPARKPASVARVAPPVAPMTAPARPPVPQAPMVAPAGKLPGIATAPVAAPVAPAMVPAPRPPPEPPEDEDWEWTIAMARARAAADDTEQAVAAPKFVAPVMTPVPKFVAPVMTPAPLPKVLLAKTEQSPFEAKTVPAAIPVAELMAQAEEPDEWDSLLANARTPKTIIPVPQMPRIDPSRVRPAAAKSTEPLRRVPRSTHRTLPGHAVSPANDDRTKPSITLPTIALGDQTSPAIPLSTASGSRRAAAKQK